MAIRQVDVQGIQIATKMIFELLIEVKKRHFYQYDKELEKLQIFGNNYLALQSIEPSKRVAYGWLTE